MPLFHIERRIPGIQDFPKEQVDEIVSNSEVTLVAMRSEGKNIRRVNSIKIDDAVFCVYEADSAELVTEHGKRSHMPTDVISEVCGMVQHDTSKK